MADLTDALTASILSGSVGAQLNQGLRWAPKNIRGNGVPSKIEGRARIGGHNLGHPFDFLVRLNPDKPWSHTCILMHVTSCRHVKRLDLRGSHRDRETDELWLNKTHKHKWTAERGDRFVYTPDDIRHDLSVPNINSMKDLSHEYKQVFEDFTIECNISLGDGYSWVDPPYPEVQETFPGLERYP